MKFEFVAFLF